MEICVQTKLKICIYAFLLQIRFHDIISILGSGISLGSVRGFSKIQNYHHMSEILEKKRRSKEAIKALYISAIPGPSDYRSPLEKKLHIR